MTTTTIQQLTIQLNKALSIAQNLETEPINLDIKIELEPIKETDTCYLCLEDMNTDKNFISYCCGHKTHFTCFIKNNELSGNPNNCGYCRQKIISNELKAEIKAIKRQSLIDERRRNREYLDELRAGQAEEDRLENIRRVGRMINNRVVVNNQVLVDSDSDSDSDIDLDNTVVINQPLPVRMPVRQGQNMVRHNRRNGNRNLQLVIDALNSPTNDDGSVGIYQTINQLVARIQGLGDGAIRRHIRTLVNTNRVQTGLSAGRARNYRLVANHQRHA